MQSPPALLRAYGLYPKKGLGQNFLIDRAALNRIAAAAELAKGDTVIEVGAGLGTLTRPLAGLAGRVTAIEVDRRLVDILGKEIGDLPNVRVVQGDVLKLDDLDVQHLDYKVVGNLPYYITSAVLRRFLEHKPRPSLMVVTVQKEVAQRIVSGPGQMSVLAVSVQFYGQPSIVARIPAGAFFPVPKVDSAVVRIDVSGEPMVPLGERVDDATFFRVVRAGFGQKRKMLRNALSSGLGLSPNWVNAVLDRAGIDARRRAETLSLQEWADVVESIATASG